MCRSCALFIVLATLCTVFVQRSYSQETVFNVPSADILERGKVYGELDVLSFPSQPTFAFTPRAVAGLGHGLEAGVNFLGTSEPATGVYAVSPAVKWKFYDGRENGWSAFGGANLFAPVRHRGYNLGSYLYLEVARSLGRGPRVGAGIYYFSPNVVARAQRAGGQFSVEQKLSSKVTVAADWFTGKHASGYLTPGIVWSATKKVAIYAAYQIGNSGLSAGNHGPLIEFGYYF